MVSVLINDMVSSSSKGTVTLTEVVGGPTTVSSSAGGDVDDIELYVYRKSVKTYLEALRTVSNVTVTMTSATGGAAASTVCHNTNTGVYSTIEFGSEFGDLPLMTGQ